MNWRCILEWITRRKAGFCTCTQKEGGSLNLQKLCPSHWATQWSKCRGKRETEARAWGTGTSEPEVEVVVVSGRDFFLTLVKPVSLVVVVVVAGSSAKPVWDVCWVSIWSLSHCVNAIRPSLNSLRRSLSTCYTNTGPRATFNWCQEICLLAPGLPSRSFLLKLLDEWRRERRKKGVGVEAG